MTADSFEYAVCTLPSDVLLEIGKRFCADEAGIRFFSDASHPRYHGNQAELKRTIRTAWKEGDPEQRRGMEEMAHKHLDPAEGTG